MKNGKQPNPNVIHPINDLIPILTSSDLGSVKEELRARL